MRVHANLETKKITTTITTLKKNDVKVGKGQQNYAGNKTYQKLISMHKKEFVLAQNKSEKDAIVMKIYNEITNVATPPGRFVARNSNGTYTVIAKSAALQKIKRCLNENQAVVREHLALRGLLPQKTKTKLMRAKSTTKKIIAPPGVALKARGISRQKSKVGTITRQDYVKLHAALEHIDFLKMIEPKKNERERKMKSKHPEKKYF